MARRLNLAGVGLGVLLATTAARAQAEPAASGKSITDQVLSLGIALDQTLPAHPLTVDVLGRPMTFVFQLDAPAQWRSNYAFADRSGDDEVKVSPSLGVDSIWALSDTLATFVGVTPSIDARVYREGGGAVSTGGIELSQAWFLKTRLFGTPFALQVGRQFYQDEREWWWSRDLDTVRLHYFGRGVSAFIGVGQEVGYKSTLPRTPLDDPGILRILGNVTWTWAPGQSIAAYFLDQTDRSRELAENAVVAHDANDQKEANLTWFGVRAHGRAKGKLPLRLYYSADLAGVTGRQTTGDFSSVSPNQDLVTHVAGQRVHGWAYDTTLTLESPFKPQIDLTFGYASGSGHRGADGSLDYAFSQSGLDTNNGKFRGLGRFHYYGEVLRPELSNLSIATVSLGMRLSAHDSIEAAWHDYRQPVADRHIVGSYLAARPDGVNPHIGEEVDLVFSHRPSEAVDLELVTGGFRAGPAFDSRQGAWASLVKVKLNLSF